MTRSFVTGVEQRHNIEDEHIRLKHDWHFIVSERGVRGRGVRENERDKERENEQEGERGRALGECEGERA